MAATFIASASNASATSGQDLDCSSSLNVAAGDLLIAVAGYLYSTQTTESVAKNSGSPANTFTFDSDDRGTQSSYVHTAVGYVLSAAADASATFRLHLDAAREYRSIIVLQFRPNGLAYKDTRNKTLDTDGGTPCTSGTITTTGTDEVVVGGVKQFYDSGTTSVETIGGTTADGYVRTAGASGVSSAWYRILAATMTSGQAQATLPDGTTQWNCHIVSFYVVPAGNDPDYGTPRDHTGTKPWSLIWRPSRI